MGCTWASHISIFIALFVEALLKTFYQLCILFLQFRSIGLLNPKFVLIAEQRGTVGVMDMDALLNLVPQLRHAAGRRVEHWSCEVYTQRLDADVVWYDGNESWP